MLLIMPHRYWSENYINRLRKKLLLVAIEIEESMLSVAPWMDLVRVSLSRSGGMGMQRPSPHSPVFD